MLYGHDSDYSLSDALWTCADMFSKRYSAFLLIVVIVLELLLLWWMFFYTQSASVVRNSSMNNDPCFFYTQSASMVINSSMRNDPCFFTPCHLVSASMVKNVSMNSDTWFCTPSQPGWLWISVWTVILVFFSHTQSTSMIINISVHPDTFFFYIHSTRMVVSAWTVMLVCFLHPFNQDGHKCQHFLWFGEPCSHCEHGAFCSKDNLNSKRVMLFTNNDDPHAGKANLQVLFPDVSVFLHFCLILSLFPFFLSLSLVVLFLWLSLFLLFSSLSICLSYSACACVWCRLCKQQRA